VIAFDAHRVDPSIVSSAFLPSLFDAMVVGNRDPLRSVSSAFTDYVGRHTSVLLIEKNRISRFTSTPYSMPHGKAIICCGQAMQFRGLDRGKGKILRVKLRCRLRQAHTGPLPVVRYFSCARSIPGIQTVVEKGGHRFIISHFQDPLQAQISICDDDTPRLSLEGQVESVPLMNGVVKL
jgi:hypothetical protein